MPWEIASHWRLRDQRYQLIGKICGKCDGKIFPPREICPECADVSEKTDFRFSGKGEVYSYTAVSNAPEGYEDQAPYVGALIKLEEGPLVTAQLTDIGTEEIKIGMPVEMVTRKLYTQGDEGLIIYGYKFRPCLKRQ